MEKNKKQITKIQHYIPKMLLKRFSISDKTVDGVMLYSYDKRYDKQKEIGIKNICCKTNLYELKDNKGMIHPAYVNLIENHLSKQENIVSHVLDSLINEQAITSDECAWLYIFIALQILRMPNMQFWAQNFIKNNSSLNAQSSENYAKVSSLLFGILPINDTWMFDEVIDVLFTKKLWIYTSNTPLFLSGDSPVLILNNHFFDYEFLSFFLPIAPSFCIALLPKKAEDPNSVIERAEITEEFARYLNRKSYESTSNYLYSGYSLKEEINRLKNLYKN